MSDRSNTSLTPNAEVAKVLEAESSLASRRKRLWYLWSVLVAIAVVGAGIWLVAIRRDKPAFRLEQARRGDLVVTVAATGNLEPTNQVEVGVEVSGTVETVEADYNDHVARGQVLARLDPTKFEAQVVRSRAALSSSKARVLQAQATVEESRAQLGRLTRLRQVSKGTDPSQLDIDAAQAALKRARADRASAKADVAQAKAALESAEIDLAKSVVHSPVDGVVLERSVEPGQTVAASLQTPVLFVLAEDLTKMELHVSVDEADVGRVREGQKATFTVDAYADRPFSAEIAEVHYGAREVDGVITYEAVLNVDNADLSLRPGMTATATIVVQEVEDAVLVPNAALRFSPPVEAEAEPRTGLVGRLLPRPPRSDSKNWATRARESKAQRVWILEDGQPLAVPVVVGASDGFTTELLQGDVEPGTPLIVDASME